MSRLRRLRWTLLPQRQLIAALLVGAGLIALTTLSAVVWVAVAVYHAALLVLAARDGLSLPRPGDLVATRRTPRPFSLGAREEVQVEIRGRRAAQLPGRVADHAPVVLGAEPREAAGTFDGQGVLRVAYVTRARRRGAYRFDAVDIRCWRPGGWWVRQVRLPLPETVPVYPDVLAVRRHQFALRRGLRSAAGLRRARPPGASTAFAGLRDYVRGDDARRISWKATARRDHPVTVEVEAERGQQLLVAVDCGRLMNAQAGVLTKHDHAVNAALLLAHVGQTQGDRVGLLAFSDRVLNLLPPQRGAGQVALINRALYSLPAEPVEPDFGAAFSLAARRLNRRSLVIVLTDVMDTETSRDLVAHALRLGRRHLVLVVAMADPTLIAARAAEPRTAGDAYRWAAAEELLEDRARSFEILARGGVLGLDVEAGKLSPALVERYLELKERALL
ncbi:MAG TPA: DUF58 domain-containing protein [Candidatus Dormibacteraeota bacterium]